MAEMTSESRGEIEKMRALMPVLMGGVTVAEAPATGPPSTRQLPKSAVVTPGEVDTVWRLSRDSVAEWVIKFGSDCSFVLLFPLAAAEEHLVTELNSRSNFAIWWGLVEKKRLPI